MSKSEPEHAPAHSVAVLISDGLGTFEFGLAVEIFGLARPEFDFPWYTFQVVASDTLEVRATGGITIKATAGLERLSQVDTIVVPSWKSDNTANIDNIIIALRAASERGARVISICSGAFLLAAAGLLKDKKVTTHWKHIPHFKSLYPDIEIEADTLYIDHGQIICSAGSAAGIDACLHLVRRDFGAKVANNVARRLVAHPHRDGGQAQFIPSPVDAREKHTISSSMDWALKRLDQRITVHDMAAHVHMSERTFLRRFRETVGNTPMDWLQRTRIFKAQELLENTSDALARVAEKTGYQSLETFRVAFKRNTGVAPGSYRSRFQTKS